jgi:hypothetical protein
MRPTAWALFCVFIFTLMLSCRRSGNHWREIAPMPEPRWFHVAAVGGDGRIYAYAGHVLPDPDKPSRKAYGSYSLVIYDPKTNRWTRGPSVPSFRYRWIVPAYFSPSPTAKVIVTYKEQVGKVSPRNELPNGTSDLQGRVYWFSDLGPVFYDPKKGKWDQPPPPTRHQERQIWATRHEEQHIWEGIGTYHRANAATATGPDGRIYLLGGIGGLLREKKRTLELLSSMEIYDPKTNKWMLGASMHQGRQIFSAAFAPDGKLYVFGGYGHLGWIKQKKGESGESYNARVAEMNRIGTYALSSVETYDSKTDTWTPRASMPVGVEGSGAALGADGKIYVVGGTRNYPDPYPERLVQIYDPLKDTWTLGPKLKARRQGLAVTVTRDGRIYAIGGTSEYYVFHPRMLVGGEAASIGGPLASVEVLDTAPKK